MKWRLGLDLGTNSIGWSVLTLNEQNEANALHDMGVRIFSDGRDPNTKEPLAVARRTTRGIRKNNRRKKSRRKNLFAFLREQGLFPVSKEECKQIKTLDPYFIRAKALDEKVTPVELARALFHIGVRRGFKSNRKDVTEEQVASDNTDSSEKNDVQTNVGKMTQGDKCLRLHKEIQDSGARTLGEYLYKRLPVFKKGQSEAERAANLAKTIRFRSDESIYYPLRQLYEKEFSSIKAKQEEFFPQINWEKIHDLIFFQRPLKPQERGRCQFMPDKERSFKAMPSSHSYRILQEVYNLRVCDEKNNFQDLTREQETLLITTLHMTKEISFDKIRKLLNVHGLFNLESDLRNSLKGNESAVKLRNEKLFGSLWDTFSLAEQDEIVETLIVSDEDSQVETLLQKYSLTEVQRKTIVHVSFSSGTTALCKEITQKLVFEMQDKHLQFDKALILLGFEHSEQKIEKYDSLPYYGKAIIGVTMGADPAKPETEPEKKYGKIANPTVHVALNQTRTVINELIKVYGKPTQVAIELSRELKSSRDAREKISKKQSENSKQNKIYNASITDCAKIQYPNRTDRQKYKLWLELGETSLARRCVYCGETIGCAELFTENIEIEHILPFSRTLWDAESNLTVAHKHCNAKKREQTPYEAFAHNPQGYDWEKILERAACFKSANAAKKRKLFSEHAMDDFSKDNAFIARQLTDNAYLSKICLRYLQSVCDNVWAVSGGMTKILRDKWKFDSILKRRIGSAEISYFGLKDDLIGQYKKNRYDHRHHALDSLVIALIDHSMVQHIATKNAHSFRNKIEAPELPIPRGDITEKLKNLTVSFKPDHGTEGKLSKETLLGCIKVGGRNSHYFSYGTGYCCY